METISIGSGDYHITTDRNCRLISTPVGYGIVMVLINTHSNKIGMMNMTLPDSRKNRRLANEKPGLFIDSGVPHLLSQVSNDENAERPPEFNITVAGGADVKGFADILNMGSENIKVLRETLKQYNLRSDNEELGGTQIRVISINTLSQKVSILSPLSNFRE